MNSFRTEISLDEIIVPRKKTGYSSLTGFIGSCFSEHMAKQFYHYALPVWMNPFGILFHPFSVEKALSRIVRLEYYREEEMVQNGEFWYSFDHHSDYFAASAAELTSLVNEPLEKAQRLLSRTTHLFVTLGTAYVFVYKKDRREVANCHKIPAVEFEKKLSTPGEIYASLMRSIELLKDFVPGIQIVFSVSPVRHLKNGMIANNRSKAHLLTAIHRVVEEGQALYFPSYEILMDDLRDYRFYKENRLHPSPEAVDYIFEILKKTFIEEAAEEIMVKVDKVRKDMQHIPRSPHSKEHMTFLKNLQRKKDELKRQSGIDLEKPEQSNLFIFP